MTAVDTNVLLHYLVRDDPQQAEAARTLLESFTPEEPAFICREVVIETVWVLERSYRLSRAEIADLIEQLIHTDRLVFEDTDDIARVALRYRQGGADFADLMILAAAERVGATPLYTFDQTLARVDGAVLVETTGA